MKKGICFYQFLKTLTVHGRNGRQDYSGVFSTQNVNVRVMSNQMATVIICFQYLYCLKCICNASVATGFANIWFRNCSYTFCTCKEALLVCVIPPISAELWQRGAGLWSMVWIYARCLSQYSADVYYVLLLLLTCLAFCQCYAASPVCSIIWTVLFLVSNFFSRLVYGLL